MKQLSTEHVVIRIAVIIAFIELLIMVFFGFKTKDVDPILTAVLDVVFLTILSSPLIYLWVIKPFVSARDEALKHINRIANIDPLTELINRRHLTDYLKKYIASCHRHNYYSGMLLIDLDEFKLINDTFGHEAGDVVLIEIAKRLQSISRAEDVVSRLGGDEFIVLINHLDTEKNVAHAKILQVAKKLINLVNETIDYNGNMLQVGASIGIRLLGPEKIDIDCAMREADRAMYRAKKAGKGCVILFDD